MLIRMSHHYDAPVDRVMWSMTDESTLRAKYAHRPGGQLLSYRRVDHGPSVEIVQERVVRFPVAPEAAKVLVPEPRIRQEERWDPPDLEGGRHATIHFSAAGLPVRAVCHVALRPVRGGTTRAETTVDLSCDVPVIGGRILDAVARAARQFIDEDATANEQALADADEQALGGPTTGTEPPVPA